MAVTVQSITEPKTIIGVLASHDSVKKNNDLAQLFIELWKDTRDLWEDGKTGQERLNNFHFVFTGGTFNRVVEGSEIKKWEKEKEEAKLPEEDRKKFEKEHEYIIQLQSSPYEKLKKFLVSSSTSLPDRTNGGVTILSNLIVQRRCRILWPFLSSETVHWLSPENLALMRLCDIWNEKRLMNRGSVLNWFQYEAKSDVKRNPQKIPLTVPFGVEGFSPLGEKYSNKNAASTLVSSLWVKQWDNPKEKDLVKAVLRDEKDEKSGYIIRKPEPKGRKPEFWEEFESQTIALIAHNEMKSRMVNFAVEYERELGAFSRILTTGTTGKEVSDAARKLEKKIKRCQSGPKGGDIEIATEILCGRCDVVVFFIDPLNPHPHIEDIRTVFSACMVEDEVRMLTNEVQAREWMDHVVRPRVIEKE